MAADIRADSEIQPDAGIPKPQLDVVAHPVDTYVKPVSASASALGQLAGALKGLNPALDDVEQRFKQTAEEQGAVQAQTAFTKEKGDWDAAVKNGDIPSVLNPFARMRAREVFGHLAGDKMAADIYSDPQYIQENQNATTMQQHDAAWANARQRWESTSLGHDSHSDPIFQSAYQGMATEHEKDARNKAWPEIEKNFVTLNGEHLHDELMAHIVQGGLDGTDQAQLQTELSQMAAASGLPETVIRSSIASAIDDYAHTQGSIHAYDLASGLQIKGYDGKTYDMSTDRDFAKLRNAGEQYILSRNFQQVRMENASKIQAREAVENNVVTGLAADLAKDPNASNLDLKQYTKMFTDAGMGSRVSDIPKFIKAIQDKTINGTDAEAAYTVRIKDRTMKPGDINYVTTGTLTHALADGKITMSQYKTLQQFVDKRDKQFQGSAQYAADPDTNLRIHESGITQVKQLFSAGRMTLKGIAAGGDPYLASVHAEQAYDAEYDAYVTKHKDDLSGLRDHMNKVVLTLDQFYFKEQGGSTTLQPGHDKLTPTIGDE